MGKRGLTLARYEGVAELTPQSNLGELKNLLDAWVRAKLGELFEYDWELKGWVLQRLGPGEALCFNHQVELTPDGYVVLWLNPSRRRRYTLADYVNEKLAKLVGRTVQEIGKSRELRENPVVVGALREVLEAVEGEYAAGEGKEVDCVTFTKDGEKQVRKGRVVSVIPDWTDECTIKPERQDYLMRRGQATLTDYLESGQAVTVYQYLCQRKTGEAREYSPEYPVILVKVGKGTLYFTPSDVVVRPREVRLAMAPAERYEYFRRVAEAIASRVLIDLPHLQEPLRFVHGLPRGFEVRGAARRGFKLEVVDKEGWKPLPILRDGGKPLAGQRRVYILYVAPRIEGVKEVIAEKHSLLERKFSEHNLGEIVGYSLKLYEWVPNNVEKTRLSLRRALEYALGNPPEVPGGVAVFPVVVGPDYRGRYYEDVKRVASERGKHSQIVLWSKFLEMSESVAATLACDIYVEVVLQEDIDRLDQLDGLLWRLAQPADGSGETVYIGFDYSLDREGRVSGAFALLCDSYGRLVSAKSVPLRADYVTEDAAATIFAEALEKARSYAERKGLREPRRVVFYRDGDLGAQERVNIIEGFRRALRALDLGGAGVQLDLVEVIKRHSKRMYLLGDKGPDNPRFGDYIAMPPLSALHDGRALVVSSEGVKGATAQPVELRFKSVHTPATSLEKVIDEFLALSTLYFWSPLRKPKLCLPLILAHNLANLSRTGVQPRLPR